jgi:hypothetical protein
LWNALASTPLPDDFLDAFGRPRHPGCRCALVPTEKASPLPDLLARLGRVRVNQDVVQLAVDATRACCDPALGQAEHATARGVVDGCLRILAR